ncbi:MAG TPA: glycosyltransferase family 39 protein [Candidatus Limnocylindrales bacterium]
MKVLTHRGRALSSSPRLAALARFLLVGFSGILVNEIIYVALTDNLRVWFVASAFTATAVSTTWNFVGNEAWSFSGRRFVGRAWVRYTAYAGMNVALLGLRVPMLWALTDFGRLGSASSNLITLGVLFVLRFAVSDGWVWRTKEGDPSSAELGAARVKAPKHRYDIGGLIRLDSDSELPELAYFRTESTSPPDIRIRVRRVGALPSARVRLRRDGERITYREHLGVLGADFNVTMGNPILIDASPLLGLSRHVLYTNVVEALLRFVLVSKGYVLLHSAGLEVEGKATLLSAQTDTGKTSTVINLVRDLHWRFISDDMAIIDPAGFVRTFPKPMTLSYHTMTRAVDVATLSPKKRMQLQVQSRVHSKSGRTVGKGLGSLNVPIMSINSVLQIVVPPPKYHITKLLPAHIAVETPIANVFLMERGEPVQERVELEAAIDQLIENTDDAYGFPPFATLAPQLVIGGENYEQLRAHERRLLTQAIENVTVWRLRVRGHEWGELLPKLILGTDDREPVGIQIETNDREPVGIPIETGDREPVGFPAQAGAPVAAAMAGAGDYASAGLTGPIPAQAHGEVAAAAFSFATTVGSESFGPSAGGERPFPVESAAGQKRKRGKPPRAENPAKAVSGGMSAAAADAIAMQPVGSFGLAGGMPFVPSFAEARARTITRIRTNARVWVSLTAILLVAAAVRLWAIGAVGFNNDEAVYAGQGASLAGDQTYSGLFAIFRAHPLLVQFLNSLPFRFFGVNDITPRLISVAFGLTGVALAYATGALLYNRRVGLVAAAFLALMPYHVVVTRQALLDGPETTLFLLSVYEMARFARSGQTRWLYGAAFTMGLTVLAKETAVLLVPVVIAFLLLSPEIRIAARRQLLAIALFLIAVAPYPAAILIGKGTGAAQSFLLWQVLRQANHPWTFYADVIPAAMGPLVLIAGLAGLLYVLRRGLWEDRLVVVWIAIPVAFFELWPVKGYQYLLPLAPAVTILAGVAFDRLLTAATNSKLAYGRAFDRLLASTAASTASTATTASTASTEPTTSSVRRRVVDRMRRSPQVAVVAASALLAISLISITVPTVGAVGSTSISGSLAGTGGLPGGRDTGAWIRENVPQGAVFLTVGPTMANIVEFYGQRKAYGLSVSPNPIRRNPAYDPIVNPDRSLQLNKIQYIVTDVWSAQRSPFFDGVLRNYVHRYHGVLVYQQSAQTSDGSGRVSTQVVIQIYEVRP